MPKGSFKNVAKDNAYLGGEAPPAKDRGFAKGGLEPVSNDKGAVGHQEGGKFVKPDELENTTRKTPKNFEG